MFLDIWIVWWLRFTSNVVRWITEKQECGQHWKASDAFIPGIEVQKEIEEPYSGRSRKRVEVREAHNADLFPPS